jgi:hypothetical protein
MSIFIQLIQLIKALTPNIKSQNELDDAFLAESANAYDLECRMREIDQRSRNALRGLAYGPNFLK